MEKGTASELPADADPAADFRGGLFDDNLQEQRDEVMAIEAIYAADREDAVQVLSAPDDDGKGLFTLQISVQVKTDGKKVMLNIWQDAAETEAEGACAEAKPPTMGKSVNFSRSDSGQRWIGSLEVSYLLPLSLQVVLPPTYPSQAGPRFSLSAAWLSAGQLSRLCGQLDQLSQASPGLPVLYTWLDWLENNTLSHLGITDSLVLIPNAEVDEDSDPRAIPDFTGFDTISQMMQYNHVQEEVAFYQNSQECQVCFDQKPGTQFYRMLDCPHHFCHECMAAYCNMHVSDGTVEKLKCPDMECEESVAPGVVLSVLPAELGERWERLMLQKSLDTMGDVVWCPRCRSVVIKEEGEALNLAVCTVCYFAFCTECEEAWHQGRGCATAEGKLEELNQKRKRGGVTDEERRRVDAMMKKLEEEKNTAIYMTGRGRRHCPKCRIPVEKNGGCNKMTCRCGSSFCWICGKAIAGYQHFTDNPSCSMSGDARVAFRQPARLPPEAALLNEIRLEMDPDAKNNVYHCPGCKQRNLRRGGNNHMRCWNCNLNSCFLCGKRILKDISAHFRPPSLCKQHS